LRVTDDKLTPADPEDLAAALAIVSTAVFNRRRDAMGRGRAPVQRRALRGLLSVDSRRGLKRLKCATTGHSAMARRREHANELARMLVDFG
jgi:hypothetical protein